MRDFLVLLNEYNHTVGRSTFHRIPRNLLRPIHGKMGHIDKTVLSLEPVASFIISSGQYTVRATAMASLH
jgi:hypothetical protein